MKIIFVSVINRNDGKFGISVKLVSSVLVVNMVCVLVESCCMIFLLSEFGLVLWLLFDMCVIIMLVVIEISSEGICDIMVLLMDSMVKWLVVLLVVMLWYVILIMMFVRMLISVMIRLVIVLFLMNFMVLFMLLCNWFFMVSNVWCLWVLFVFRCLVCRLVLMFICLLGMVLSVKCVLILVICLELLVIMMNCMVVMIRNIIRFIIRLLFIMSLLKFLMMWLVFVCSRMDLVDVMFSESCSSVVNNSSDGNVDSDVVVGMYIVIISSMIDSVMFSFSSELIRMVGSGSIINVMMVIINVVMLILLLNLEKVVFLVILDVLV